MATGTQVRRVLLQIQADEGDSEAKIDAIAAKAEELGKLHPELKVRIDTAAANAKLKVLRDELKGAAVAAAAKPIEPKVAPKPDIPEAVKAGEEAAKATDRGFRLRMSPLAAGWGSLIGVGLAALPAAAAGTGALMAAALGAKLLIGTKQVQGPLYKQFEELQHTLVSVMRVAALPLLGPLRQAFEQIGTWAKQMEPLLQKAFGAVGPLIAPLARGLEGLVSGLLPGFVALMRAAAPAVSALSGLLGGLSQAIGGMLGGLAPAVRASSVVLGALGLLVRNLMPVVTSLARSLASALGPALRAVAQVVGILAPPVSRLAALLIHLGGSVLTTVVSAAARLLPPLAQLVSVVASGLMPLLPPLERYLTSVAGAITGQVARSIAAAMPAIAALIANLLRLAEGVIIPLLPQLAQLTTDMIQLQVSGVLASLPPIAALANVLVVLANKAIVPLMPLIQQATGLLVEMANAAVRAMNLVNSLLGMVGIHLGGGGGGAMLGLGGWSAPAAVSLGPVSTAGYSAGLAAGSAYGGAWADGMTAGATGAAKRKAASKPVTAADLAVILAGGAGADLTGTAAQVRAGTAKLIAAITQDERAGVLSKSQGSDLTLWLDKDSARLQGLANRRMAIMREIAAAQKYAASVATNIRQQDGLTAAAAGGWNGGPQTTGQIIANLRMDVGRIRQFAASINKLRKLGLNKAYLDELIQMGPDAGGQLAEQLANSGLGDIRQINAAESQIFQASGGLGKAAANAMYDSGAMAGKGFLSGLEAQQAAITKMMAKIAKAMIDTLKHELGIHSPSTVTRDVAHMAGLGIVLGHEDMLGQVRTSAARMARAMVPQPHGTVGASGGAIPVRVTFDFGPNVPGPVRTWLKKSIRINGGNPAVVGA